MFRSVGGLIATGCGDDTIRIFREVCTCTFDSLRAFEMSNYPSKYDVITNHTCCYHGQALTIPQEPILHVKQARATLLASPVTISHLAQLPVRAAA